MRKNRPDSQRSAEGHGFSSGTVNQTVSHKVVV